MGIKILPNMVKRKLLPYYESLIHFKRDAVARLVIKRARNSKDIIITSTGSFRPMALSPGQSKEIFIENVKRGKYRIEIVHEDAVITKERRALFFLFEASSGQNPEELATGLGVNKGDKGAFSYMGGGRRRKGKTYQIQDIHVHNALHWLKITAELPIDRFVNIDQFGLDKVTPKTVVDDEISQEKLHPNLVNNWIERTGVSDNIKFIIYADIDMNIVDGSSVWLSSMISVLSGNGKTLVIAKRAITSDIITSNINEYENVTFISPDDLNLNTRTFSIEQAVEVLRNLDDLFPNIERIFIRGLNAAFEASKNRQFYDRACVYLTNFYDLKDNQRIITSEAKLKTSVSVLHSKYILAQTSQISNELFKLTNIKRKNVRFPPPVPVDGALEKTNLAYAKPGTIRIGYAGKIVPLWGVDILLSWVSRLQSEGVDVETYIVANRISDGFEDKRVDGYANRIRDEMKAVKATHFSQYNRAKAMGLMSQMDYVWCYRPSKLEENTLELSTKLVEMASLGKPCLAYPNTINKESLGENYPFFVSDYESFRDLVKNPQVENIVDVAKSLRRRHGLNALTKHIGKQVCSKMPHSLSVANKKVLFAGHDFKFVDAFISHIKGSGTAVKIDRWNWGDPIDIVQSKVKRDWADVIFCEWGLANAVWHSNNKKSDSRLIVRVHLQEINPRAQKFGYQINSDQVDCFIFVSERVRQEAIKMFGFSIEKTIVVPNYVLDLEYELQRARKKQNITLGMVGIIPSRKRFDRAVNLLKALVADGFDANLKIKGPRPEEMPFMHAPSRVEELEFYYDVYAQIDEVPGLSDRITFEGWGNDVALWYRDVDFILSPSDFESFHYAVADGVLSGCWPIIWPWDEAKEIYDEGWIVKDDIEAINCVKDVTAMSLKSKKAVINERRDFIISRYGHQKIFSELTKAISM